MFNIIRFDEIESTMDTIKLYPPNTIVIANRQTKGRGKDDRKWVSNDDNNLYMSVSIKANVKSVDYSLYSFLVALVVINTIKETLQEHNINIKTKWPNDILLNNKKICGILLERDLQKQILSIGIGLNINSHPNFDDKMLFEPSSLLAEGYIVKKEDILRIFTNNFEKYSDNFEKNGFSFVRSEWIGYDYNFKKEIIVKINKNTYKGIFKDLDEDGTLILDIDNNIMKMKSGDIYHN